MKTTMYTQWKNFKKEHPNMVILFRVGGFYEALEMDAYILRKILGFKMSLRATGQGMSVPMVGFPPSALENHLVKLGAAGINCALITQLDEIEESGLKKRRLERHVAAVHPIDLNGYKKGYEGYLIKHFPMVVEIHELRKVKEKDVGQEALILKELRNLNINGMTGYDALKFLYNWQKKLLVASYD